MTSCRRLSDVSESRVIHRNHEPVETRGPLRSDWPMTPLTRNLADQAGIGRHQLYSKRFRQVFRGVFVPAEQPMSLETWIAAARLALPDHAKLTGLTALQSGGLDIGQPLPLQFATNRDVRTRREGITLVRRSEVRAVGGTVPNVDAAAEACRTIGLADAVCILDRALHLRLISPRDLTELRTHTSIAVRQAAALARQGAESVRETQLRLCLVLAGLPEPQLQVELWEEGVWLGRYDMSFEGFRTLAEYDGDQHRTDKRQWNRDIEKNEGAQRLGHSIVHVTAEFFRNPWEQVVRVDKALRRGGYTGPAPRRTPAWEAGFGSVRRASVLRVDETY